jgi:hypothetical protein
MSTTPRGSSRAGDAAATKAAEPTRRALSDRIPQGHPNDAPRIDFAQRQRLARARQVSMKVELNPMSPPIGLPFSSNFGMRMSPFSAPLARSKS